MNEAVEAAKRIVKWADTNITEWERYAQPLEHAASPGDVIDIARAYLALLSRSHAVEEALRDARSQMHNLPRSLSADAAVSIIDAALEEKAG